MRFCHPRDLVHQIGIFCRFYHAPPIASAAALDAAATRLFLDDGLSGHCGNLRPDPGRATALCHGWAIRIAYRLQPLAPQGLAATDARSQNPWGSSVS